MATSVEYTNKVSPAREGGFRDDNELSYPASSFDAYGKPKIPWNTRQVGA